ncbi:MAG: head GIN domain-containing protein [Bacteroidota bacterium]|nr:head GIN domain-containing protein [Bacteroidota bacterium]
MISKNVKFIATFFILSLFLSSCSVKCEKGSGVVVKEVRELDEFTSIELSSSADVYITQGDEQSVYIEIDDNVLEFVKTEVKGNELEIYTKGCIITSSKLKVFVTMKSLKDIDISGSGEIHGENQFHSNEMSLDVSGSGKIFLSLQTNDLKTKISGSGEITLEGNANKHNISISGSGDLNAFKLKTVETDIDLSGSGEAFIDVVQKLDAKVSGSGDVEYNGDPKVRSKISGSGSVMSADF